MSTTPAKSPSAVEFAGGAGPCAATAAALMRVARTPPSTIRMIIFGPHHRLRAPAPFLERGPPRRLGIFGTRPVSVPVNDSPFTAREGLGRLAPAWSEQSCLPQLFAE